MIGRRLLLLCSYTHFFYSSAYRRPKFRIDKSTRESMQENRSYSMTDAESAGDLGLLFEPDCPWPCRHHPVAPQYPNGNATPHLETFSEFVKAVATGLSRVVFPRSQQQYSSVHVLMISWEEDDIGTETDLLLLKQIFEQTYRYSTNHCKLPSEDPDIYLEKVISETKWEHGRDENGLLIIYYGGHGEIDKSTQHSIWKAWKSPPRNDSPPSSPKLDWSDLQGGVLKCRGDVFFILDCCYAAGAMQVSAQRRNFLLASGNDKASNQNTLTKAIIYELKELRGRPCTVFSLHYCLVANRLIHQWITVPIHIGEKRIILAPLDVSTTQTSSQSQQLISIDEEIAQEEPRCRILVSVTLTTFGIQSARDAWVEWIRDHAPPNIAAFDFLDIASPIAGLSTNSDYLIFTLRVPVWNAMTPNAAIKFLSIVYSQDLLYHDGYTIHEKSDSAIERLRGIGQGRYGQLLNEDSLAKDIFFLIEALGSSEREVTSLRQENDGLRHRQAAKIWSGTTDTGSSAVDSFAVDSAPSFDRSVAVQTLLKSTQSFHVEDRDVAVTTNHRHALNLSTGPNERAFSRRNSGGLRGEPPNVRSEERRLSDKLTDELADSRLSRRRQSRAIEPRHASFASGPDTSGYYRHDTEHLGPTERPVEHPEAPKWDHAHRDDLADVQPTTTRVRGTSPASGNANTAVDRAPLADHFFICGVESSHIHHKTYVSARLSPPIWDTTGEDGALETESVRDDTRVSADVVRLTPPAGRQQQRQTSETRVPKSSKTPSDKSASVGTGLESGRGSFPRASSEMDGVKLQPSTVSKTLKRMSGYNSALLAPEEFYANPDMHPLRRRYKPVLLDRYPSPAYTAKSERRAPFPDDVPMYAFPNDVTVVSSDERPRSTWHGFTMTDGDGVRMHGVCVIIWLPLNAEASEELERRCEAWRMAKMSEEERYLSGELSKRLPMEKEKLSTLLAKLPAVLSGSDEREALEEEISVVEEKISLMAALLQPRYHRATSMLEGLTKENTGFWIPRAYGVLGRDSNSTSFWKEWLKAVVVPMTVPTVMRVPPSSPKVGFWQPLERYVVTLCVEAASPVESTTQVEIGIRELRLYARKEAPNEIPGSRNVDLYALFRCLSIPNIMALLEFTLAESRIIFVSSHTAMLHLATHALISLLYPLKWAGVLIPVLPKRLIRALDTPRPYIMGVERAYEDLELPDGDFCLVDLDEDLIESTIPPTNMPRPQRRKLQALLQVAAPHHNHYGVPTGPPAYAVETYPYDAFMSENPQIFDARATPSNLSQLVSQSSTEFADRSTLYDPRTAIYNAFATVYLDGSRSHVKASDSSMATGVSSRNDSGYASQASLPPSKLSRRPPLSSYARSVDAQSTLAPSTINADMMVQPVRDNESTKWIEGHCFLRKSRDKKSTCAICDERCEDECFRCSCESSHTRCDLQYPNRSQPARL